MKDLARNRFDMFIRVREEGSKYADLFPPTSFAGEQFALLDSTINELETYMEAQVSGLSDARAVGVSKAAARDELVRDLQAINRTARPMAHNNPGIRDKFRVPYNQPDQILLAAARAILAEARPLKAEFVKRGLPADFLEDLEADIAQLEEIISRQAQSKTTHVEATAALDDLIERGMTAVRELDPIMRNTFANNPTRLAGWLSASHVERQRRRAIKTATGPTPTESIEEK